MPKPIYLLLFSLLFACQEDEKNADKEALDSDQIKTENQIIVNTTVITNRVFQKQILANGIIEARHRSEMRFRQTDNIQKIAVKNGDVVQKNQLIAKLDQTNLRNIVAQAQQELEAAETRLITEKANYGIGQKPDSLISANILYIIRNRSGVNEAEARLSNRKIMLEQSILQSPFYGRVANLNTKEGNFISSAEVFCTVLSHQELDVIFNVIESELPYLSMGQAVQVHPFGNSTTKYKGEIIEINPLVEKNGLVRIKAKIANPSLDLFDGMNMKVVIEQAIENVLVVPKEALVLRSNREVIFSLKQGKSNWNYVEVIDENTQSYAIREGVNVADTIIISNNMNLAHDARVQASFVPPPKDSIQ
jgi:RND family efflux transporter MFP subunit